VVLDTNVLVSGLLNPSGRPGRIVDLVLGGEIRLLVDDRILAEYRQVLRRPRFGFAAADIEAVMGFLETESERVLPPALPELTDPKDQPFLEVAAGGGADSLITGNTRHFSPGRRPSTVHVESPAQFLGRGFGTTP
jgi:putative PIN family toxin of toxin-antitoxin system